jgi:uncharacterized membrane protein HdeD (DUF308 family)
VFLRGRKPLVWRGVIAFAFGALLLSWRGVPLSVFALLFGAYALVDGAISVAMVASRPERRHAWLLALNGGSSIVLGLALLWWPAVVGRMLVVLLGCYEFVSGASTLLLAVAVGRRLSRPS